MPVDPASEHVQNGMPLCKINQRSKTDVLKSLAMAAQSKDKDKGEQAKASVEHHQANLVSQTLHRDV